MDKDQYKLLLERRYLQELMLFELIKEYKTRGYRVRDVIYDIKIPDKRAAYILLKWSGRGIYNYGVALDLGWLEAQNYNIPYPLNKERIDISEHIRNTFNKI